MTKYYLDLYSELQNRLFTVEVDSSYDTTGGLRDNKFISKGIEPLFKPVIGKAEARVPLKVIIDMVYKDVSFTLASDDDLYEIINMMDRYVYEINKIDTSNIDPYSEVKLFLDRFYIAFSKFKELGRERKLLFNKHNPNRKRTLMEFLAGE